MKCVRFVPTLSKCQLFMLQIFVIMEKLLQSSAFPLSAYLQNLRGIHTHTDEIVAKACSEISVGKAPMTSLAGSVAGTDMAHMHS